MDREGGCLCGGVRFTAHLDKTEFGACHCQMCRRWSGGPLLAMEVPAVTWADPTTLRTFRSSDWAERLFCGTCGSSVAYRLTVPDGGTGAVHLAIGALDDQTGLTLTHEVFVDRRPDGYAFAGSLKGLTEAEVFAMFAPPPD